MEVEEIKESFNNLEKYFEEKIRKLWEQKHGLTGGKHERNS
jgi:hypothetical protein